MNHHTALLKAQNNLREWMGLNVSWFGCSALIKMIILPRLLYLIQAVPILLPPSFLSTYRKACSSFLWRDSSPHIKFTRLILLKSRGGIGLPDLYNYYTACHLTRRCLTGISTPLKRRGYPLKKIFRLDPYIFSLGYLKKAGHSLYDPTRSSSPPF